MSTESHFVEKVQVMEGAVIGPLRGYYIATCACSLGELGKDLIGYHKVSPALPAGF